MKKLFIKNYLINSILKCGKKELSEKILLKTFKELQRTTKINTKNLIKLAIGQTDSSSNYLINISLSFSIPLLQ